MNKVEYPICGDGYAYLDTCEQVIQYFKDNDIIGKFVKCVDLYMIGHDRCHFGEYYRHLNYNHHRNLPIKMAYFGDQPTYFVCEFTDGNYLVIDYSNDPGLYIKYGSELTMPDCDIKYISPESYNHLFDNLKGERLTGISVPVEYDLRSYRWCDIGLLEYAPLDSVYLDFQNNYFDKVQGKTIIIDGDDKCYCDSVGFRCSIWKMPEISYYSDRDIEYFKNE